MWLLLAACWCPKCNTWSTNFAKDIGNSTVLPSYQVIYIVVIRAVMLHELFTNTLLYFIIIVLLKITLSIRSTDLLHRKTSIVNLEKLSIATKSGRLADNKTRIRYQIRSGLWHDSDKMWVECTAIVRWIYINNMAHHIWEARKVDDFANMDLTWKEINILLDFSTDLKICAIFFAKI